MKAIEDRSVLHQTVRSVVDIFESIKARDAALERVAEASRVFMSNGFLAVLNLPQGEYSGEDIRLSLSAKGIVPDHPNAWGALIMNALRKKVLVDTGKTTKMKMKTSHARKTSIYWKG